MRGGQDLTIIVAAALVCAAMLPKPAVAAIDHELRCRLGAYRLADGRSLAIMAFEDSARDLGYVLSSGEYGRLAAVSADTYSPMSADDKAYGTVRFSACSSGKVMFRVADQRAVRGHHLALNVTDTFFASAGVPMHGKLVMPENGKAGAVVVWIQGSEDTPETDDIFWQYVLPLHGIGIFVYDKRGTGQSGGETTADFYQRAADTAAAVRKARALAPAVSRFGVFGGSQGGWIAPLTATFANLDFVIVGYGLAEGVTAQDRDDVEEAVRAAGFGDDVMPKVREITTATARVAMSGWKDGWDALAGVKQKYSHEPWFKAIDGENGYTAILLRTPEAEAREMGPKLDRHVSFTYDPRPVIASISPRQLWVLGGSDRTAPSANTIEILAGIQKHKANLDLVIYKNADHGIAETFVQGGVRHRYPAGYFDLIADWIAKGTLPSPGVDLDVRRSP